MKMRITTMDCDGYKNDDGGKQSSHKKYFPELIAPNTGHRAEDSVAKAMRYLNSISAT